MNLLSLRNNRLKFKTTGKLPIMLEEFIEYTQFNKRKFEGCQHVTGWTCKTLGSQPIMPKKSPEHRGTSTWAGDVAASQGKAIHLCLGRWPKHKVPTGVQVVRVG